MGLHPYTEKPSKGLRNSSGLKQEISISKNFHGEGIPLLISPLLLRNRNLGQIDVARMKKDNGGWLLEIAEVKSSEMGIAQMELFQKKRLYSSQHFLAGLFGCRTKLISLSE